MSLLLRSPSQRVSRWMHPLAWWSWGLATATAAIITSNFWFHAALFCSVFAVLWRKGSTASWSRATGLFARLALFIILFRLMIEIIFGVHFGGAVLLTLPEISLPNWLGGLELGGAIGANGLISAFVNGFALATIVVAAAAPSALVPPDLLLKSLPSAIYEAGLVTVIALGFLPTLSADAKRIKTAAALRGKPAVGMVANMKLLLPLIDSSLGRAVMLANAMETKGFGKTKNKTANSAVIAVGLAGGLLLLIFSLFNLLRNPTDALHLLILLLALSFIAISVVLSGKAKLRTSYRSLTFGVVEFLMLFAAIGIVLLTVSSSNSPWALVVVIGLAFSPIWITPDVPKGFQA